MGSSRQRNTALEAISMVMLEEGKILERDNLSPEEAERIGQSFMKDQKWGDFAKRENDRTKRIDKSFAESMTPSRPQTGTQLNAAAMDRVGFGKEKSSIAPTIIDASTVQNVSNNTLIRPPSPSGQFLPGERRDFG